MNVMSRVRLQTPHYYCDLPCSGDPTEYCGGGDAQINGGVWHRETVGRVGGEAGAGRGRAGRGGAGQGRAGQGRHTQIWSAELRILTKLEQNKP